MMNTRIIILFLTGVLSLVTSIRAADFDMAAFDKATQKLASYKFGDRKIDLDQIENLVSAASADTRVCPQVEQRLLNLLAEATTYDSRQFICRLLRTIGTAKSVESLEPLLTDPEMSHMARFALGRIEAPEAGQALLRALGKTQGNLQAGVINTLAQRHYSQAAPEIADLVSSSTPEVALAAIRALGRLGGENAAKALTQARSSASESAKIEIDNALLTCAETFVVDGKMSRAAEIYRNFYTGDYPVQFRIAGFRGLALSQVENADQLLLEAIKGNDPALRQSAVGMLSLTKDDKTKNLLVSLVQSSTPDVQELSIIALAERGEVSAAPAVIQATGSEHENVRLAAYEALGELGNEDAVDCLAKAAATASEREKQIARGSLGRIKGTGIDQALIRAANTGDPKSRKEVIQAIGLRNNRSAFAPLYRIAETEPEATVRQAAILSAGRLGAGPELKQLVDLAVAPKDPDDRSTIQESIALTFNNIDDRNEQANPVISALKSAPKEAKPVLLGLLNQPATPEALAVVRAALKSDEPSIVDAAIHTLSDWPNSDPAGDLYEVAATTTNTSHRALALRSYVHMGEVSTESTPIYVKAMKLAGNDEEIKMVLSGLGNADTLEALELAEKYMTREGVKTEASLAAVQVAGHYSGQNPLRARATLDRVITEAQNESIRTQARDALKHMDDFKDYLIAWKGVGPYKMPGVKDGLLVFGTPFEPEKNPDSPSLRWVRIRTEFDSDKRFNVASTFGQTDYCCAYLRTQIWSPEEQEAKVRWDADDFIKGWINGGEVAGGTLKLRKGNNTLLLKVGNHEGGWSFSCKLLKPDGASIKGLRCEPN
jgi:HEAT repeat protein